MQVTDKIKELRLKGVDFEDMFELNKQFKDVEELKEKIIQMINQHKQQNRDKFKLNFDIKSITVEKLEEILKFLEE